MVHCRGKASGADDDRLAGFCSNVSASMSCTMFLQMAIISSKPTVSSILSESARNPPLFGGDSEPCAKTIPFSFHIKFRDPTFPEIVRKSEANDGICITDEDLRVYARMTSFRPEKA